MDQEIIQLLSSAKDEINSLRRANEILAAKVEVMDLFAQVLRTEASYQGIAACVDVAWEIQHKLDKLKSGLSTVDSVRAIMGDDVPVLVGDFRHDIPWVKRLREKTNCGLKEAKDAMEMMLDHASRDS